jgi:uncharacterized membrane protein YkvA (DUF1232 family)
MKGLTERRLFRKARALASRLPLVRHVLAMWNAFLDPHTPLPVKATILIAIGYFILPFDLIPDFLVGIGYADDFAVIMGALRAIGGMVKTEHYALADRMIAEWREPARIA